jgi:hypothetical protein
MSCPPSSPRSFRREWSNVERGTVCFVNRNSTSPDVAILTLGDAFCMQEEFIKCFTRAGHQLSSAEKRGIISYRDMGTFSSCSPLYLPAELPTQQLSQLKTRPSSFLKVPTSSFVIILVFLTWYADVVPLPMPLSAALDTRALKEKERIDEDPALSTRPIPSPLPKPTPLASAVSHPVSSATTSRQQ